MVYEVILFLSLSLFLRHRMRVASSSVFFLFFSVIVGAFSVVGIFEAVNAVHGTAHADLIGD
jgi:hypothetical protein